MARVFVCVCDSCGVHNLNPVDAVNILVRCQEYTHCVLGTFENL